MPGDAAAVEVDLVDEPSEVAPALARLATGPGATLGGALIGVDVERADSDRYHRDAALVQVGTTDRCVLLDGVALAELYGLQSFLAGADRIAVLHALDNDLDPLAAKGVTPPRVADTAVAATVLGLPTGLRHLLAAVLDLELDGDKNALQRADWAARPLTPEMIDYAAGDVVHLPALWSRLAERLEASGRRAWYEQELAATIERATSATRHWTRVKGAGRLSPRERAVLRHVWEAREALAREHDIAPNRLVHDDVLRDLATDPPGTEAELVKRSMRRRSLLRRHAPPLLAAVIEGASAPPEPRDGGGRRWTEQDRAAYDALRRARAELAEELGLDAGVLCPSKALSTAVAGEPADAIELCTLAGLRPWQTELLAEVLWDTYVAAYTTSTPEAPSATDDEVAPAETTAPPAPSDDGAPRASADG